jgi:alkanesulfonate monooxygenase SsuD/methylene tetrahydromethanopterin reductase-like flavin-dependent oxidoreductase (luciferase family)
MIAPRQGFAGETITFKSAFFGFQNVRVTPEPVQKPHPPIWLGGFTQAALRRAVRFGNGFTVPGANRDDWVTACRAHRFPVL